MSSRPPPWHFTIVALVAPETALLYSNGMYNFPSRPPERKFFPYPEFGPKTPITSLEQLIVAEACVVQVGTDPTRLFDCPDAIQSEYTAHCIERAREPYRASTLPDVAAYSEQISEQETT